MDPLCDISDIQRFSEEVADLHEHTRRLQQRIREVGADAEPLIGEAIDQLSLHGEQLQVANAEILQQHEELIASSALVDAERERYYDLFENAPDAYVVTNMHGLIREANRMAFSLLRTANERLVGRLLVMRVAATDRRRFRLYQSGLATADAPREIHVTMQPRGGEPFEATVIASVIRQPNGLSTGIRWRIHDLTLRNRAGFLEDERVKLLSENARLNRVALESSHRIKNHLQALSAIVDLHLADQSETLPAEEFRQLGRQIQSLAAIHDLMTINARSNAASSSISAKLLLGKILGMLNEAAGKSSFRSYLEDCEVEARTAVSLALVTNELCANAMKHAGTPVDVRLTVTDGRVRLEVCDDGPGFPAGFRADTHAHTGLELVEQVVKSELGGSVDYGRQDGRGALVTVEFPLET